MAQLYFWLGKNPGIAQLTSDSSAGSRGVKTELHSEQELRPLPTHIFTTTNEFRRASSIRAPPFMFLNNMQLGKTYY